MQIIGEWLSCEDGVTRPTILAGVHGTGGQLFGERFLVDSCADRTVFSTKGALNNNLPKLLLTRDGILGDVSAHAGCTSS